MKLLLLAIAFSCAIPVCITAQCDTYLSIETLIKIKKDFDEAEDLLINCFTKMKDGEVNYNDGTSGRVISYDSKKEVDFGENCTAPKESISTYFLTGNLIYTIRYSAQYLKLKNVVKTQGKKVVSDLEKFVAYTYRGLRWEFQTTINDICLANSYVIIISKP